MPNTEPIIEDEDVAVVMRKLGGSFVQTLGALWAQGDADNRRRIKAAWPEYWEIYTRHARRLLAQEPRA
jgi:hypothetical protein